MCKSYQVIQKVASPMINEKANKVPEENFTVKVKDVESKEEHRLIVDKEAPVKKGESVLFSSGSAGESAHFTAQYRLTMPQDIKSGNYETQIAYSLLMN